MAEATARTPRISSSMRDALVPGNGGSSRERLRSHRLDAHGLYLKPPRGGWPRQLRAPRASAPRCEMLLSPGTEVRPENVFALTDLTRMGSTLSHRAADGRGNCAHPAHQLLDARCSCPRERRFVPRTSSLSPT